MKDVRVSLSEEMYDQVRTFASNRALDTGNNGHGVPSVMRMALKAYLNKYSGECRKRREDPPQRDKMDEVGEIYR